MSTPLIQLGTVVSSLIVISHYLTKISKSCYYHVREIRCIRPYLNFKTASTIATSTMFTPNLITAILCTIRRSRISNKSSTKLELSWPGSG